MDREARRAKDARYYAAHKAAKIESVRKYRKANPDKVRRWEARYDETHREIGVECNRRYRAKYPELVRERARFARASRRALENGGDLSAAEWDSIVAAWCGRCAYCGKPGTTMDHMIPLKRGGKHDKSNVVPACASCNYRKQARLPLDFIWRRAA